MYLISEFRKDKVNKDRGYSVSIHQNAIVSMYHLKNDNIQILLTNYTSKNISLKRCAEALQVLLKCKT